MKFQLLPGTFKDGRVSNRQHFSCLVIDNRVAIDAGSLGDGDQIILEITQIIRILQDNIF